jgi:hypothetical protein
MIGSFTLEGDRELTYWIDPLRWGRVIASGALEIFIRRETQRPLSARVAAHNLGSSKMPLRNGLMKTGEEMSCAAGVGGIVPEHIYRLDQLPDDRSPLGIGERDTSFWCTKQRCTRSCLARRALIPPAIAFAFWTTSERVIASATQRWPDCG